MTKTSCISHLAKQQLVMIRQDYLMICDCDHCAAAILNVMEYWTNIKLAANEQAEIDNTIAKKEGLEASQDTELWIYKSHEDFKTELLDLFGINKIGTALTSLKGKGFLSTRNNPRFGWDRTVQYLFITDTVQAAVSSLDLKSTSFKNKASQDTKLNDGSFESNEAIPQTTTKTTTEKLSRKREKVSKADTIPAALMNPMKDAIVAAFGWDWKSMTKREAGLVQGTAKELCTAGFESDRVMSYYAWCKAKFTKGFSPAALSIHLSEYRLTRLDKPPVNPDKPLTEWEHDWANIQEQQKKEAEQYGWS